MNETNHNNETASFTEAAEPEHFLSCMEKLNYTSFRVSILAKSNRSDVLGRQLGTPSFAGAPGQLGLENIFKTLMNEIKSLQLNQSIFEFYIKNMHSCYGEVLQKMEGGRIEREKEVGRMMEEVVRELADMRKQSNIFVNPLYVRKLAIDWVGQVWELEEGTVWWSVMNGIVTFCTLIFVMTCVWNLRVVLGGGGGVGGYEYEEEDDDDDDDDEESASEEESASDEEEKEV